MDVDLLSAYLPMERRHALAAGHPLPDRATGTVLLADIAGFTPLADAVTAAFGAQRGAEELTRLLNDVYDVLIARVHRYGGSVVSFVGDALVCWFVEDRGQRAVACGLAMQEAMGTYAAVEMPGDGTVSFSMKAGVALGPVRRFLVGDPQVQRLDVLAGAALERMAQAEQLARRGEIVVGPEVARQLGERLAVATWREDYGVVAGLTVEVSPTPWPVLDSEALTVEGVCAHLLPPVYERLLAGQGEFLAELRPAAMLFLRFAGIEYEDDEAGPRLDAYVCWLQQVLRRYDGYLLQLTMGDKGSFFYAAFGALAAHEDDAERAVAAALALQQLPPELGFISGVQVGVSRGRVRVGAYGGRTRRTYGAIGSEVNVACRLMEAAPVGEVRCSRRVYRAAGAQWEFAALPPVQVKGRVEPLAVYRPLRRKRRRVLYIGGALVGRQVEVETLGRLLVEAVSGQRRIVLLEGEAGIGKSRLVGELAQLAGEAGVAWLLGAGQSIEQHTPYRAWRDLLAAHFGLNEQTALSERQRQVRERVVAMAPALVERLPLLDDILRLDLPETELTRSFDPKLRHESLTALVVDLLRATTAQGPLALVLEDAHWLDSLSWELALSVARGLADQPLLLVLVLRPLEEPRRAEYTALASLGGAERVKLEVMPAGETVALAAARLGVAPDALPDEVVELVWERAGGNAFFAEELAYALRDSGVLDIKEGVCALVADLATLQESVPDTVEGVVLSRIDRLPPEQQLTLKVAAVVGRSFLYRTLRDVHPQKVIEDLLHAHLDDLAQRDLTSLETLEPEMSYLFKHVITQQVAYDTLLFAQRQDLHRTVAGWYERVYADDLSPYYPLLVHHWHRAENVKQELHYCRLAGEQAAARYANAEAVAYLSRALELIPEDDLVARFDLLLAREQVNHLRGERAAQVKDLATLETLMERLGSDRRQAIVALRQANYYQATSDFTRAAQAAQQAVNWAAQAEDPSLEVAGYVAWGRSQWLQDNPVLAREYHERGLALAQAVGDQQGEADCLYNLGIVHSDLRDFLVARDYCQRALVVCEAQGNQQNRARLLTTLGNIYSYMGNKTAEQNHQEQALAIYRAIGNRRGVAIVLYNLSLYYHGQGEGERARRCCEEALATGRALGERRLEAYTLTYLGLLLERLYRPEPATKNDLEVARSYYAQALAIRREINQPALAIDSLAGLVRVALTQGDLPEALRWTEEILEWIVQNGIDGIGDVILVYQTAYRVFLVAEQRERAKAAITNAYDVLMEWADRLPDKEARRSMLEDVWPHGEVIAAYRAMQAEE